MSINDKDFIRFNYTAKVKETGKVFDTSYKEVAEEADIFSENKTYKPIVLAVGTDQFLLGLQEEMKKMDIGESKIIELPAERAYGKRDPNKIRLIPMSEFKKQNLRPFVGMPLTIENEPGIVRTISGGRVRVDFNHELAGKDLIYDVEIIEEVTDVDEKVKEMIDLYYGNPNLNLDDVEIEVDDGIAKIKLGILAGFDQRSCQEVTMSKFRVANILYENIDEIDNVQFIDEFKQREETSDATDDTVNEDELGVTEDNIDGTEVPSDSTEDDTIVDVEKADEVDDDTNIEIEFVDEIDVGKNSPEVLKDDD